ncbi:asparagine synthetase A [Streptomyces sp. SID12501]|uniref:Asparaginase n=1 Tax=Streptomyces sp. SID12501 TaxID=2706042 RepID=A0A6B3BTP2_9ACTN|nr:asparagine synthetase A [Streptomyces sp. SID12501]NEC87723.1 asparaginase [Streptomyces sp. SID12501]
MPTLPSQVWKNASNYHLEVLRNPWYRAVARLQNSISELTLDYWRARGGQTLHLPVTTGSISSPMGLGSDSLPVSVDLMGAPTYLADSMQFMLEFGCRLTGTDAYYVMPSFRGEDTDATHLCQFFHSEAEIVGGLDEMLTTVEDYLRQLAAGLLERDSDVILGCGGDLTRLERLASGQQFRRITFDEAAELLGGAGIEDQGGWRTLTREGERLLMEKLGEFLWVTHWDHLAVPFYQAFGDPEGRTALNADLLFGMGEVVGAGERHVTAEEVRRALDLHQVDAESYNWYLEMRDFAPLRTSGFGLGIERFLMWVLDHDDIRDFQLLPRRNGHNIVP